MSPPAVLNRLRADFRERFGREPRVAARAPGRVNLIGEHTDYCDGLVLPCAIDLATFCLAAVREESSDPRIEVYAADLGRSGVFPARAPERQGGWLDYVQGVFYGLAQRGREPEAAGLDLMIASHVPREAGLSSSAALGVALATALNALFDWKLDAIDIARAVHTGECEFVGVGCGILDQFASALGREGCALRIDCRSQECTLVEMPSDRLRILIADSGVKRALAQGGYRERVEECARALARARASGVGSESARSLRDFGPADLPALERVLPPTLFRRVRHVVSENARVDGFCAALRVGDLAALGSLLAEGQRSLRDDYEVSTPELDALCESADALPGVLGSRLTGAGFGGCTLHLVRPAEVTSVSRALAERFEARFGRALPIREVAPAEGASVL